MESANMRKESILLIDNETNDFIYNEQGLLIGVSKDGTVQFLVDPKGIDVSANQLLVKIDEYEAIIHLEQYKEYFEKLTSSILLPSQNNCDISDAVNEYESCANEDIRTFVWNENSTKFFLALFKEKREDVTNRKIRNLKKMWETIATEMTVNGYSITAQQAENKMKSLNRAYKNMISHNKKTGRNRVDCLYRRELDDILGKKHNIKPLVLCGSRIGTQLKKAEETPNDIEKIFQCEGRKTNCELVQSVQLKSTGLSSSQCSADENLNIMQEHVTATENVDKENCDVTIMNARNSTDIDSSIEISNASYVKKKKTSRNVDAIKDTINNILEEFQIRRKESGDFQTKYLELQEKIAINKIPAREKRNNILKEKNVILQEQNRLLKNQNSVLEAILSELKQLNNLT